MSIDQRSPSPRSQVRTEQRIIAAKPRIGSRPAPGGAVAEEAPGGARSRGGRRVLTALLVAVLLVGAGAAYWFLLGPGAGTTSDGVVAEEPAPEPGEVLTVDAVSLNLAGGHYLRLGIALQLTAEVEETPDPAAALDQAIALFSGRTVEEVSSPEGREALKAELSEMLVEKYEGEVMGVYFTDYVTQ